VFEYTTPLRKTITGLCAASTGTSVVNSGKLGPSSTVVNFSSTQDW